ncbi:MAG TPA: hypothetical protein VF829_03445 [Candidatus Paceibacterota bacterium]
MSTTTALFHGLGVDIFTVLLSAAALLVAVLAWTKTRVYYDLEIYKLTGSDITEDLQLASVKEKLNSGKYTIVETMSPRVSPEGRDIVVLIGKIKK